MNCIKFPLKAKEEIITALKGCNIWLLGRVSELLLTLGKTDPFLNPRIIDLESYFTEKILILNLFHRNVRRSLRQRSSWTNYRLTCHHCSRMNPIKLKADNNTTRNSNKKHEYTWDSIGCKSIYFNKGLMAFWFSTDNAIFSASARLFTASCNASLIPQQWDIDPTFPI